MKEGQVANYNMQVIVSGGNKENVDWVANVQLNSKKIATEMIIIANNKLNHE